MKIEQPCNIEGYKIELDTFNNIFVVLELIEGNYSELKDCLHYDDALEFIKNREIRKSKKGFKKKEPLKAFYRWGDKFFEISITSFLREIYGERVWINVDNNRRKEGVHSDSFVESNPENKAILKELEESENKIIELKHKLKYLTVEELAKYFETSE